MLPQKLTSAVLLLMLKLISIVFPFSATAGTNIHSLSPPLVVQPISTEYNEATPGLAYSHMPVHCVPNSIVSQYFSFPSWVFFQIFYMCTMKKSANHKFYSKPLELRSTEKSEYGKYWPTNRQRFISKVLDLCCPHKILLSKGPSWCGFSLMRSLVDG